MVKKLGMYLVLTAAVFLSFSCVKDEYELGSDSGSTIRFTVNQGENLLIEDGGDAPETKGFAISSDKGGSIPVVCETSPMTLNLGEFQTKGQRFGSETDFKAEAFAVYAWDVDGTAFYTNETVEYDTETSKWFPGTAKYWPYKSSLTFAAVYPKDGCSFTGIAPDNMDFSYTTEASAADQKDLMLAYYTGAGDKGVAGLTFTHALTCVNFKAGTLTDVESIDEISLDGVYAGKGCTVTLSNEPAYNWDTDKVDESFIKVTSSGVVAETDFATLEDNPGYNFMLIPQDVQTQNVTLTVTLTTSGGQQTFTKTLDNSIITCKWVEGNKYTFVLGYDGGDLTISVDDDVKGNVKDNLSICNTGKVDAYFRVALVGNWQNDAGEIMGNWDETQGTFTDFPGTNWFKEGDFYYYKNPVLKAGETPTKITDLLFTKYEAPATPSVTGTTLHLNVVVQAVKYDNGKNKVTEAWGSTVASKLNTK